MSENIHSNCREALASLGKWRERYSPSEYPDKVVLNLFYTVMPLAELWSHIRRGFSSPVNTPSQESYRENKSRLVAQYRQAQTDVVQPKLKALLANGCAVGSCRSQHFKGIADRASQGNNSQVEELEFSYVYYDAISNLVLDWGALGMMGLSGEEAYGNVAGMMVGGVNIQDLGSVVDALGHPVAFTMNSGGGYRQLPPLW